MHEGWPFIVTDKEPEQALEIVYNYLERKYGDVPDDVVRKALELLYELYRKKEKRPLVLANKVIPILEGRIEPPTPKAA